MNKEIKNEIILEISFKLQANDYKFSFATRRAWLVGAIIIFVRIVLTLIGQQSP